MTLEEKLVFKLEQWKLWDNKWKKDGDNWIDPYGHTMSKSQMKRDRGIVRSRLIANITETIKDYEQGFVFEKNIAKKNGMSKTPRHLPKTSK